MLHIIALHINFQTEIFVILMPVNHREVLE